MLARVSALGEAQATELARIAAEPWVRGARRIGTVTAFEVGGEATSYLSDLAPRLRAAALERDVLLRPLGNTVYVMPPYCIGADHLAAIYDAVIGWVARLGSAWT